MKKFLSVLMLMAGIANAESYWPIDSTQYPIQRGIHLGYGYVVGTNDNTVAGSIAIGGKGLTYKAIVLDAQNAVQLGTGTNVTSDTIQFQNNALALVFVDSTSNTVLNEYTAPMAGCILVGKDGGVNEVWTSTGKGTNWNRIGNVYSTVADGSITASKLDPSIAGEGITFAGNKLSANYAQAGVSGALRLPNIVQTVKRDVMVQTSTSSTNRYDVTGLSATIIPHFANSKIKVTISLYGGHSVDGRYVWYYLQRNGSDIAGAKGDANGSCNRATGILTGNYYKESQSSSVTMYLDSPATTNACTYSIQIGSESGTFRINLNGDGNTTVDDATTISTITAEEIYQ
jgi:hypothetical protein